MKILYITTIGLTMGFFNSFIRQLLDEGNDVEIATNETDAQVPECYREWGCQIHPISCTRFPFDLGNMKAISQIRRIVKENGYDIVHCHTPIAAMCTRIACRPLRKNGLKVFYTAHGFHFYDGAPLKNWLIYYPVEKWLSKYTDILITINKEDFRRATEKFHAKKTVYIPGVGVDTEKFAPRASGRERIRTELELKDSDIMILSVGELNENKNHETFIRAIKGLNVTYVIAGKGEKQDKLETIAKEYGVDLRLLGFRTDVSDIYDAADVFVLPSIREGLNVSLMEAMATGLSCAVSKIRGNTDLIEDETVLFDPLDKNGLRMAVKNAIEHRTKYGQKNLEKIRGFDIGAVRNLTDEIYMAGGGGTVHLIELLRRQEKRKEIGVPLGSLLMMSVGELNVNKNHSTVIRALSQLNDPDIHYVIVGDGNLMSLIKLSRELDVEGQVHFLGYRKDVADLYNIADICVFPSIREGLGVAAIEGMASGLPLIASLNRGTRDYADNGINALLCNCYSPNEFANAINQLKNCDLRKKMSWLNVEISKHFDVNKVNFELKQIYKNV